MNSLLISNARLLDPASGFDGIGHLGIRDGLVTYAGTRPPKKKFDQTLDAKGLWLMPGIVDLCARLREPGQTRKASIASELRAANAGGITTLCVPPDTSPVIDSPAVADRIHAKALAAGGAKVHVLGALTRGLAGEALAEMGALRAAGCVGFSQGLAPLSDPLVMRRALEYARGLSMTVHVVALDARLANQGCAHEGPVATRLGLPSIPVSAEVSAIRQWLSLVEDTGGRVHFGRLSSARGVSLIENAQKRGLPVTADVAAHQLFLIDADVEGFNAQAHVIPPLRSAADREALRQALTKGVISAICSDHQPHEADAKINPFPLTEPGISALETLLTLTLTLVHESVLTPLQAAERLSLGPATILGLECGSLASGARADLILIDPDKRWTLCAEALLSMGRNTPFADREFRGRLRLCLNRGGDLARSTQRN